MNSSSLAPAAVISLFSLRGWLQRDIIYGHFIANSMGTSPVNNWHSSCPFPTSSYPNHIDASLSSQSEVSTKSRSKSTARTQTHSSIMLLENSFILYVEPFIPKSEKKKCICISWGKHQCLQGRIVLKLR